MKLREDWRMVVKKAWSVRLMILAAVLSGIEVALPFFSYDIPRNIFATLSGLVSASALVARVVVQKDVT